MLGRRSKGRAGFALGRHVLSQPGAPVGSRHRPGAGGLQARVGSRLLAACRGDSPLRPAGGDAQSSRSRRPWRLLAHCYEPGVPGSFGSGCRQHLRHVGDLQGRSRRGRHRGHLFHRRRGQGNRDGEWRSLDVHAELDRLDRSQLRDRCPRGERQRRRQHLHHPAGTQPFPRCCPVGTGGRGQQGLRQRHRDAGGRARVAGQLRGERHRLPRLPLKRLAGVFRAPLDPSKTTCTDFAPVYGQYSVVAVYKNAVGTVLESAPATATRLR